MSASPSKLQASTPRHRGSARTGPSCHAAPLLLEPPGLGASAARSGAAHTILLPSRVVARSCLVRMHRRLWVLRE
eukprot:67313-Prorocentrum_lima.AAC.1